MCNRVSLLVLLSATPCPNNFLPWVFIVTLIDMFRFILFYNLIFYYYYFYLHKHIYRFIFIFPFFFYLFFYILVTFILIYSLTTSSWLTIPAIRFGFVILEMLCSLRLVKHSIANTVLRNSLPQRLLTRHQSPRQLISGKTPGAHISV